MTNPISIPSLLLSRRSLLGALGLGAAATIAAPSRAEAMPGYFEAIQLGRGNLVFEDDFTSSSTIDYTGRGTGDYNWYSDLWDGSTTPAWGLQVANSVLTINQAVTNTNFAISTVSPRTGRGRAFGYGYYEARMRFDPSRGTSTNGYPSFWSLPKDRINNATSSRHGEIDFFEAYHDPYTPYYGHYVATVHDAQPRWAGSNQYRNIQNRNNLTFVNLTQSGWHNFGCLWMPGRLSWYFDGSPTTTVYYGKDRFPSCGTWDTSTGGDVNEWGTFGVVDDAAANGIALILGTAPGWPLEVDWVRVFQ